MATESEIRAFLRAIPPGDAIQEEADARGWSRGELRYQLCLPTPILDGLLAGHLPIGSAMASRLGVVFGTGPLFWLRLEAAYREAKNSPVM